MLSGSGVIVLCSTSKHCHNPTRYVRTLFLSHRLASSEGVFEDQKKTLWFPSNMGLPKKKTVLDVCVRQ